MKKVLILAYDFPPYVSVGGLRPYSWYKYMYENEIYPIIITRQWNNKNGNYIDYISKSKSKKTIFKKNKHGIIIETPYKPNLANKILLKYGPKKYGLIRKLISVFYEIFQYIFDIGPKINIYHEANNYLNQNKVDLIIATGEPFVLFKYASKLSNNHNIPWIADYRDPWTQDKNRGDNFIRKFWDSFNERKFLKNATLIITVSESFKNQINLNIKEKKFLIITNGYDSNAIQNVQNIKQNSKNLSIGFVGTIYKWHPLESFLVECDKFISKTKNVKFEINFYGINIENELVEIIKSKYPKLYKYIKIYPKLQNEKILGELSKNNLLLLFNYYSYMGTKIYDYIALKRQILLCYTDDKEANFLKNKFFNIEDSSNIMLQEELLNETESGIAIKNANDLQNNLSKLYEEFLENKKIECKSKKIEFYSRKIQTKKLCLEIHKII